MVLALKAAVFVIPAAAGFAIAYSILSLMSPYESTLEHITWFLIAVVVSWVTSIFLADSLRALATRPRAVALPWLEALLEDIIAAEKLGSIADVGDEALLDSLTSLNALEDKVSESRRRLHEVIDTVQAEVTRRYTTGEATIDGILSS